MPIGSVTPTGFSASVGWLGGTNFGAAEPFQFQFTDSGSAIVPQRIQASLDLSSSFHGTATSGRDRVKQLVSLIRDTLVQRTETLRTEPTNAAGYGQSAIDSALSELATLVGTRFQPGGEANAELRGVNPRQVSSVRVTALPPNGKLAISGRVVARSHVTNLTTTSYDLPTSANFNRDQIASVNTSGLAEGTTLSVSGTVDHTSSAAELVYEGSAGTVTGSATFRLVGPDGSANLSVTAGESLADAAQRINDQTNTTGVIAEVQGDTIKISTNATGASATVSLDNLHQTSDIVVTGVNNSQIGTFQVSHISDNSQFALNGNVTQAASRALLTYSGDSNGNVTDTAQFTVRGATGTTNFTMTQGESLGDVASRINQRTPDTGVEALTSGTDLLFRSTALGSQGSVSVELTSITQYTHVAGVNANQITAFQVNSAHPDSQNTLTGDVTQLAAAATLTYEGLSSAIAADADFTLTGNLGSTNISVLEGDSLTTIRDRINDDTHLTGVSATVSGDQLILQSSTLGTNATLAVSVNSGSFNVTGGNGDGTANGTDAALIVNGQAVGANGNQVSYSDAWGSYSFTLADGFLGAFDSVTVTSSNGAFTLTGGDGHGAATGQDATATFNGQNFVATGNSFSLDFSGEVFLVDVADGFTGLLDPIDISSTLEPFTITGGDGNRSAQGSDMAANLNGQAVTSTNGTFTVTTPRGNVTVTFADSFTGSFDPFAIHVAAAPATHTDSAVQFERYAILNGVQVKEEMGAFHYRANGVEIDVKFAQGFRGEFDPITVAGKETTQRTSLFALSQSDATQIGRLIMPLFQLASGSGGNGMSPTVGSNLATTTHVLQQLNALDLLTYDPLLRNDLASSPLFVDRIA